MSGHQLTISEQKHLHQSQDGTLNLRHDKVLYNIQSMLKYRYNVPHNNIVPTAKLDLMGIRYILAHYTNVAVIEEHVPHGGLGSRVKEVAWDSAAPCTLKTYSLKDAFIHFYGNHAELLEQHGLEPNRIVADLAGE